MSRQKQQLSHVKLDFSTLDADPDAQQNQQNAPSSMMPSQSMKLKKKLKRDTKTGKNNADPIEAQRCLSLIENYKISNHNFLKL